MICPHCKTPIKKKQTETFKPQALKLLNDGLSMRDISIVLEHNVSVATICRWSKEEKRKNKSND